MSGKCFETVFSKKCSNVVLFTDLVSTSYHFIEHRAWAKENAITYLVDTTYAETECTAFDAGTVHEVANE